MLYRKYIVSKAHPVTGILCHRCVGSDISMIYITSLSYCDIMHSVLQAQRSIDCIYIVS